MQKLQQQKKNTKRHQLFTVHQDIVYFGLKQ
jgi:hypothetical protein